jgi:hypothetical protein
MCGFNVAALHLNGLFGDCRVFEVPILLPGYLVLPLSHKNDTTGHQRREFQKMSTPWPARKPVLMEFPTQTRPEPTRFLEWSP